jgi:hypothetical protein
MSQGGDGAAAPRPPARRAEVRAIGWSLLCGFLMWVGEALVGTVPLAAHEIVARFSGNAERPSGSDPIPEVCILAVVIAGLSVISLLRFGPRERPHRTTPVTYVMMIVSLAALISGGAMYGLAVMDMAHGETDLAVKALALALGSSLVLALERATQDA